MTRGSTHTLIRESLQARLDVFPVLLRLESIVLGDSVPHTRACPATSSKHCLFQLELTLVLSSSSRRQKRAQGCRGLDACFLVVRRCHLNVATGRSGRWMEVRSTNFLTKVINDSPCALRLRVPDRSWPVRVSAQSGSHSLTRHAHRWQPARECLSRPPYPFVNKHSRSCSPTGPSQGERSRIAF